MASHLTTDTETRPAPGPDDRLREWAPSRVRAEEPTLMRWVGMIGLMFAVLGSMMIVMRAAGRTGWIASPGWGSLFLEIGLIGLLLHALTDRDLQVRRSYAALGLVFLGVGAFLCVAALAKAQGVGGYFGLAFFQLMLGVPFITAAARHETDPAWRKALTSVLAGAGAVLAVVGFVGSNIGTGDFLLPHGLLLALAGLAYLWAFIGLRGVADDVGYRAAQLVGLAGAFVALAAFGRSVLPPLFHAWHWTSAAPGPYFKPTGFVLMLLGLLYLAVAVGLSSDNRIVVLTRRELVGFFCSPIAYFVLFGLTAVAGVFFAQFVFEVASRVPGQPPLIEPIVRRYSFGLFPVVCMIFIVPVLTMRLLSEEQRTGTLEVLLTAPVNETAVVLSKFFSALIVLLLVWAPWGLLLIPLRIEGGQPFDYRPLLSFFIALAGMGAGFVGIGVFFSSLTRNQIASAVMTFAVLLVLLFISLIKWQMLDPMSQNSAWAVVLGHMSYLDLWFESLGGSLMPRQLIFFLSTAVLSLFLTVKVLQIRRWS